MDKEKKKLIKVGAFLILFLIIENLVFYWVVTKKPKSEPFPLKAGQKSSLNPAATPSPSSSPAPSASPLRSPTPATSSPALLETHPDPKIPVPSETSQSPAQEDEDNLGLAFLMAILLNLLVVMVFCCLAFLAYRWSIRRKAVLLPPTDESPVPTPKTATQASEQAVGPKQKPLPTKIYVPKPLTPLTKRAPVHAVLIDEDPLIQSQWKTAAQAKQKELLTFQSIPDFMEKADEISLKTDIFIDFTLGTGLIGGPRSKRIFDAGFKRIFLTTSTQLNRTIPPWISMITSKRPPW